MMDYLEGWEPDGVVARRCAEAGIPFTPRVAPPAWLEAMSIPSDMLIWNDDSVFVVQWFGRRIHEDETVPESWHVGGIFRTEAGAKGNVANRPSIERARYERWGVR